LSFLAKGVVGVGKTLLKKKGRHTQISTKTKSNQTAREISNQAEIKRLTMDLAGDLVKKLQSTLEKSDINFTGDLSESIDIEDIGGTISVVINSPYATLVDKGMPAGRAVNYDALKKWVEGKLGITDERELQEATFKIQKKIENKGIQPTFFVKKSIKALISQRGVTKLRNYTRTIPANKTLTRIARKASKINRLTNKVSKVAGSALRSVGVK